MHIQENTNNTEEYTIENAQVIATVMSYMNDNLEGLQDTELAQFVQTYSLMKGLKKFGERGRTAAYSEMKQLHERIAFAPIHIEELTELERKRAMESLIFLVEKRDGKVKARTCANGSTQREYMEREDSASPTVATEAILLTAAIDAKQGRDIMTSDVPNAFIQTEIGHKDIGERIIMKIRGPLFDILCDMAPEVYAKYVTHERKQKVLYVKMLKALYGMLVSSLLYYKKFRNDIESIGFR